MSFFSNLFTSIRWIFTFFGFVLFCLSASFVFSDSVWRNVIFSTFFSLGFMYAVFFGTIILIILVTIILSLVSHIKHLKSKNNM